jgi:hypothetical protein
MEWIMARIYLPDNVRYIPVDCTSPDKTKANHLGSFKFGDYTLKLALRCKESSKRCNNKAKKCKDITTNRIGAHFKRNGSTVPVHFFDPFKGQLTPQQLKDHFRLIKKLKQNISFKVEKHGRSYSVTMDHCAGLDGGVLKGKWWENLGYNDEEKSTPHIRKRSHSVTAVPSSSDIEELGCTRRVAASLASTPKSDDNHVELEKWCYATLSKYAKPDVQVLPGVHHELSGVAFSKHAKLIELTLDALLTQLKKRTLLDDDIVDAIYHTLSFADSKFVKAHHLVETLRAISSKCKDFHDQAKTIPDLHKLLQTLGKTLDKMADCKVEALKFEKDYQPLKDSLEHLEKHPDWSISAQASYALQGLLRITNTQSKSDERIAKIKHALSGIDHLVNVALEFKPAHIIGAFAEFKEVVKRESDKKKWYDYARYLCILIEKKEWTILKQSIAECLEGLQEKEKALLHSFLIDHILEIATDHSDDSIRVGAIGVLEDYLKEEPTWGVKSLKALKEKAKDKISKLKYALLFELHELAKLHNPTVSAVAEKALLQIAILAIAKAHPQNGEGKVDEENLTLLIQLGILRPVEGDMSVLYTVKDSDLKYGFKIIKNKTPDERAPELCKVLFNLVKEDRSNLDSFIKNVASQATDLKAKENEDLKYLIETHIPPHCSDEKATKLDFEERVNKFLKGEIKDSDGREKTVLLVKGRAGGGKTTSARYLEYQLWEKCKTDPKAPIPVLISAAKLHDKTKKAVEEALIQKGFSKNQVKKIIAERRPLVVIFDGYEEMAATRTKINLHQSNTLWKFNAKTIITCRTEYLSNPDVYNSTFAPIIDSQKEPALLDEISISPFKKGDIVAYLTQFCEKYTKAPGKTKQYAEWDKVKYLEYIKPSLIEDETDSSQEGLKPLLIPTSPRVKGIRSPRWNFPISPRAKILESPKCSNPVTPKGNDTKDKTTIAPIPGLYDLLSSPYMLFIAATVLPKIVKDNPNIRSGLMIRNILMKEFVDFWIQREELRLLEIGVKVDSKVGIHKTCNNFLQNLVAKWYHSDLPVIEHDPECESEWADEFSEANEPWRTACPLEPLDEFTWGMNPVLKEYLVFRQIVDVITASKKKLGFGDKNFTEKEITDASIIQFFVDELKFNAAKNVEKPKEVSDKGEKVKTLKKNDGPKDLGEVLKAFLTSSKESSFAYINSKKILDAFEKANKSEAKEPESPDEPARTPFRPTSPA